MTEPITPCARLNDPEAWDQFLATGKDESIESHALACGVCKQRLSELSELRVSLAALDVTTRERAAQIDLVAGIAARIEQPKFTFPKLAVPALALSAAVLAWLVFQPASLRVDAPQGARVLSGAGQQDIQGPFTVQLPAELTTLAHQSVRFEASKSRGRISPSARTSFASDRAIDRLEGLIELTSLTPFQISGPTWSLSIQGRAEVEATAGETQMTLINRYSTAGAAVLAFVLYEGSAHLFTGGESHELAAPSAAFVDGSGRLHPLTPSGPTDSNGTGGSRLALATAEKVLGKGELTAGSYWDEETKAVRFRVRGEVFDAVTGAPLTEFEVGAVSQEARDYGVDRLSETFKAVRDGRFLMDGFSMGDWRVTVHAAGYAPVSQTVSISDLGDEPYVVAPMSSGATLTGKVVDFKGTPVQGARVRLGQCKSGTAGCPSAESALDGRFELAGVPVDEVFSVAAEHEQLGFAERSGLKLEEGQSEFVRLELSGIIRVFGTVYSGKDRRPEGGVHVLVDGEVRTETDAKGGYEVFMPMTSRPEVTVEVDQGGFKVQYASYPEKRSADAIRWVQAKTHVAELQKDFVLGAETATLYGTVTAANGEPMANVKLSIHNSTGWFKGNRGHDTYPEETLTDSAGRYRIAGIPTHAGYTISTETSSGERRPLGYVNIREETEVEASFTVGNASLRGRFVKSGGHEPLTVSAQDCRRLGAQRIGSEVILAVRCYPDGRFELSSMAPGKYRLENTVSWMNSAIEISPVEVDLAPGQVLDNVEVPAKGEPALTWRLRITDPSGRFVSGLHSRVSLGATSFTQNLQPGPDGVTTVELSRVHKELFIDAAGYDSAEIKLEGRSSAEIIPVELQRQPSK